MPRKRRSETRDSGGFAAIPWSVIDSAAYKELSLPAKALLIEAARQYHHDDNGRMLLSKAYLVKRGWNSTDVITRAKRELIEACFIYQTVQGHRPNKASWYACTWWTLDGDDTGHEHTNRIEDDQTNQIQRGSIKIVQINTKI